MIENLGYVLVLSAAFLLVSMGLFGFGGLIVARRRQRAGEIRIRRRDRFDYTPTQQRAEPTPALVESEPQPAGESPAPALAADEGLIEELFAELFSIRSTIAQLRDELHALSIALSESQRLRVPYDEHEVEPPHLRAAA